MTINPMTVVKQFSQSQSDLSRMDGNLTQWQSNGNIYPNSSVVDDFRSMAENLDSASLGLGDLHPEGTDLLARLKKDVLSVAFDAGSCRAMHQHGTTFGSGWSTVLDTPIADTRAALDLATQNATGASAPAPNPLKVVKNLADTQADLSRMAGNLTQWQSNGNIYPNSSLDASFTSMAGNLFDARNALRTLHPEQSDLINSLQRDILDVAEDGGQVNAMSQQGTTFGSGWSNCLDASIGDVRKAIDVLTQ